MDQANAKGKCLENPSDDASKPKEIFVEKLKMVEEKRENEKTPNVANGDDLKVNDPYLFPLP